MSKDLSDINQMVEILSNSISGGSDLWPLKPAQLFPYFDMDQCLDFFVKINELKKRKVLPQEVAQVIKHPSKIRGLILNVLCTGLKVATKLKIGNISKQDRIDLVQYFVDILKIMCPEDPFCANGTNLFLKKDEIDQILKETIWLDTTYENKKTLNYLNAGLVAYTWAFYWSYFPHSGYETYGPYNVSKQFGRGSKLVIKDFYNLQPTEIWKIAKKNPIKTARVYQIYKTEDITLSFGNRVLSNTNLVDANTHFSVVINKNQILKMVDIDDITTSLENIAKEQTTYINSMGDLDKIRKGAQMSYYMLSDFYSKYWTNWYDPKIVDNSIKQLGDKFLKEGSEQKNRTPKELSMLFDPSNDYF